MSSTAKNLSRLYNGGAGPLTIDGLKRAVTLGWISADEYQQISGEAYSA